VAVISYAQVKHKQLQSGVICGCYHNERALNYIAYGSAIVVALFAVTVGAAHLPRVASALQDKTNNTLDLIKLEQTIDAKALPRQDLPDEIYR
jgi:hypothetical protein